MEPIPGTNSIPGTAIVPGTYPPYASTKYGKGGASRRFEPFLNPLLRTHERRILLPAAPTRAPFNSAMARSALVRSANCAKPHPFPRGILTYTKAPIGSKTRDRSDSRTLGSSPPTNTVADDVAAVDAAESSFVLKPTLVSASSRHPSECSFRVAEPTTPPRSGDPSPGVAAPPAGVEDPDRLASIDATLEGRGPGYAANARVSVAPRCFLGTARLSRIARDPHLAPCISTSAASRSRSSEKRTNPNPLLLPVRGSVTTRALRTLL